MERTVITIIQGKEALRDPSIIISISLLGQPLTIGPMLAEPYGNPYPAGDAPKLRTACENCRQSKVKCNLSGKNACTRCLRHGLQCQYGFANRSGKPKGSKNRATLRKLGQLQEEKPGCSSSRLGYGPVANMEPLVPTAYMSRLSEPLDDDVGPFSFFFSFFRCLVYPFLSQDFFLGVSDVRSVRVMGKPTELWQCRNARGICLPWATDSQVATEAGWLTVN